LKLFSRLPFHVCRFTIEKLNPNKSTMTKPLFLIACLAIALPSLAQKGSDVPAFGKIEKADLEMKTCDFDEKAEAVVLFDVGELYCDLSPVNSSMLLERHVRIKILRD
jgi:hypothetical protein